MKRHLRWLIPLLLVPVLFTVGLGSAQAVSNAAGYPDDLALVLAGFGLIALGVFGPIVAAILAIVNGVRTFRHWRRSNGVYSASERALRTSTGELQQASISGWNDARELRARLIAREIPAAIRSWEVVPNPDEVMFYDVSADYARFYGTNESYTQKSGFFFGHPAFVVAGLAATSIGNSTRRNAAQVASQATWRERQPARVIVTNQRLICHAGGRWLSFPYSSMQAVYPEVDKWTLICEFGDNVEPLLLAGPQSPLISVMTVLLTHGPDALVEHPSLRRLG